MKVLAVRPLTAPPDVDIMVPGSKSITNRALVVAALAAGRSDLSNVLFSDDTDAMLTALRRLGLSAEADIAARCVRVEGWDGRVPSGPAALDVRQAGTAARFLPPLLALGHGHYTIDGSPQMRSRPLAELATALRDLGVDVRGEGLPLEVVASGSVRGGRVTVMGSATSQFLSGLLLSGPYFSEGLDLVAEGRIVSRPYLAITVAIMASFGVHVEVKGRQFRVPPRQRYCGTRFMVEPDASAASYFFAAAAITGGRVRVDGLGCHSVQGDLRFVDVLEQMGADVRRRDAFIEVRGQPLHGVEVDLADFSDAAPTLAVTAAFASTPTRITGIGFIRRKESDRIGNVVAELRRCGIEAEEEPDGMVIHPGKPQQAVVQTHDDHRMAMAFSLLGLVADGIAIAEPGCVAKTFPDFFATLDRLR